ncbi:MAG TPA: hypothetical protein VH186_15670 [Chloroflexia bacterium]|nr:hypothetical protein [Chloroflexia bacterium]
MPKVTQKGVLYNLPPRILGEGIRIYNRSLIEIIALALGCALALLYLFTVPFPDVVSIRLIIAVLILAVDAVYFVLPMAGLTGFEWTITLIRFKTSNIPRRTRARPSPPSRLRR